MFETTEILAAITAGTAAVAAIGVALNSGPRLALAAVGWIGRVLSK